MGRRYIGIVGSGEDKFTEPGSTRARYHIMRLLKTEILIHGRENVIVVSGRSPIGGVDIWAEEVAASLELETDIKIPLVHQWTPGYGYKARNIDIAKSDIVHVIVPDIYPEEYTGKRFTFCYHCHKDDHIKSGGCWTGWHAIYRGNKVEWHIVNNHPQYKVIDKTITSA